MASAFWDLARGKVRFGSLGSDMGGTIKRDPDMTFWHEKQPGDDTPPDMIDMSASLFVPTHPQFTRTTHMKIIEARFNDGMSKAYHYFVHPGDNPEIGDLVITALGALSLSLSAFNPQNLQAAAPVFPPRPWDLSPTEEQLGQWEQFEQPKLNVAHVTGILIDDGKHRATKPYLMLLSIKELKQRHTAQAELIKHEQAREHARAQLRALLQEQAEETQFKVLAESNPEAARLLDLFHAPTPGTMIEGKAG